MGGKVFETITCGVGENFIDVCDPLCKCMFCKNGAVKRSEDYLDVYLEYDGGGGWDATYLFVCRFCYDKHKIGVNKAKKEQQSSVVYVRVLDEEEAFGEE